MKRWIITLLLTALFLTAGSAFGQVRISVRIGPPPLPVYDQPLCPGDGFIWTPGYWAWDGGDYYWVPGTWVIAPEPGYLWTPGYWGWEGDAFVFNEGYWGTSVGFYGGINYGFGYFGHGYEGGRWNNGHFFYNTAVNNVNVNVIHNVYNTRPAVVGGTRVSFNGGAGGISVRASAQEEAAARERHIGPVAVQTQHAQAARNDPQQRLSANHGAPPVAGTPRPGNSTVRAAVVHPNDLPTASRPAAPSTGNPTLDQKYQSQQNALAARQNQERLKLQQQQEKQHQQLATQPANPVRTQQVEQQHAQQTQQLQQKHTQQTQQLQSRQQPTAPARGGGGSRGEKQP